MKTYETHSTDGPGEADMTAHRCPRCQSRHTGEFDHCDECRAMLAGCICAGIQAADPRRHFQGCPLRKPLPVPYPDRRHAEVLAEVERLQALDNRPIEVDAVITRLLSGASRAADILLDRREGNMRECLVNLAAWALRGIALHDGEKP